MKIKSIKLKDFKRFTDLTIEGLPEAAKLVVMIGPNGCGKSSMFDALNCYTYIVKSSAYPPDDENFSPLELSHMTGYYLKNGNPDHHFPMSAEDSSSMDARIKEDWRSLSLAFVKDIVSRATEVSKTILADCVNVVLHHEQKTKTDELKVHTRSSLRNYSLPSHFDLFSTHSAEKLRLKLSKPPTEKEEDHTFGLNHWALNLYELTYRSTVKEILGDHWPVLPHELKNYAETVLSFKEEIIGEVSNAIAQLFTDSTSKSILENTLHLDLSSSDQELLRPNSEAPAFPNLSVGEIATFDLILDIVIKRVIDDETVICIDEPELHIHTKLQGQLLQELYNLISPKSQLWIATHSVGMVRKAYEIWRKNPDSVVFLDFGKDHSGKDRDFDGPVKMEPAEPNPNFWASTYEVVLGDLAELVVTGRTVFCEGEEFDAECYGNIFKGTYPEVCFVSLGARGNVEKSVTAANLALENIAESAKVIGIVDRDKATCGEIKRNAKKGIRTLSRKTIESYLLDDEVLTKLCEDHDAPDKINDLLTAKQDALQKNKLKSSDNLKSIVQPIHGAAQKILKSANLGNIRESFMMDMLAPRIQPGMKVYKELHKDIFRRVTR